MCLLGAEGRGGERGQEDVREMCFKDFDSGERGRGGGSGVFTFYIP